MEQQRSANEQRCYDEAQTRWSTCFELCIRVDKTNPVATVKACSDMWKDHMLVCALVFGKASK
jgi:hypothetical protein